MFATRLKLAAVLTFTAVGIRAEFLPVLMIEPVTTETPAALASLVQDANTLMRERHETPLFLRVYAQPAMSGSRRHGFLLSPAASFSGLMANQNAFRTDPKLEPLRKQFAALPEPGPASYLKAIRFAGTNTPGWLCNALIETADESRLLHEVDALTTLLQAAGDPPPLINVFRFISGPGPATHLVSINAASHQQLGTYLDRLLLGPSLLNDPGLTVLSKTIYEELVP